MAQVKNVVQGTWVTVIDPQPLSTAKLRVAAYARVSSNSDDQINSYIARTRFNANAQPTYVLLTPGGEIIATRNYNLDTDAYLAFLEKAL